jgi:hypothetical protein
MSVAFGSQPPARRWLEDAFHCAHSFFVIAMTQQHTQDGACPDGRIKDASGKCVMPTVTFASLILSLNTSALYHMGELPHPETGQRLIDRELAKHSIDTLILLEDKTKGNLDTNETELLSRILYEIKMHFVKLT